MEVGVMISMKKSYTVEFYHFGSPDEMSSADLGEDLCIQVAKKSSMRLVLPKFRGEKQRWDFKTLIQETLLK